MELNRVYETYGELKNLLRQLKSEYNEDICEEFDYNYNDEDERFKNEIAWQVSQHLQKVDWLLNWVDAPITTQGRLKKDNESGRYEIVRRFESEGFPLSSGYPLDVWSEKDETWLNSSIQHNGEDYYIVKIGKDKPIEGLKARARKF